MLQNTNEQQILTDSFLSSTKIIRNDKLNLFGKGIDTIDTVTCRQQIMENIRQVDLSHNVISIISNAQQFKNVQIMNLSYNRIQNAEEIFKLQTLTKLNTLFIKGNPFLNKDIPQYVMIFLLSIQTDIDLVNDDVQSKIDEITSLKKQNELFLHYLKKVDLHIQLTNTFQLEDTFVTTGISMFPKIRKYLQIITPQNMYLKRQWCKKIQPNLLLNNTNLINFLIKELDESDIKKSKIIQKIQDRQQLLRNLRNTCNIGLNSKKTILKKQEANYNHDNQLCESQIVEIREQRNSLNNVIKLQVSKNVNIESSIKKTNILKDSPPKLLFQFKQIKTNEQFEKIFIPTLCKMNNLYHLLHSPLQSLKSHEKELLIHNLITLLKQKLKDIYKYEKIQQQTQKIKMDFNCLQKHMRSISTQIREEKQRFKRKLQKVENMYQKQVEKVHQLCIDTVRYKKEIQILKETNRKLLILQKQQNLNNYNQQIIINRHQQLLKLKYFKLIMHKSNHFSNLKKLQVINNIEQNKQLVYSIFQILKINMQVNLKAENLKCILRKRIFKQLNQFMFNNCKNKKFQSDLISRLTIRRKKGFFYQFFTYFKQNLENQSKINLFQKHLNKSLKINAFLILRVKAQQAKVYINNQNLIQKKKEMILKKYFYVWKKYIPEFIEKTINCQKTIKKQYLSRFIDNQNRQIEYCANFVALSYFLSNFRKLNAFHKFTKTLSSTLFCRKIKLFKIIKNKKQVYLNYFISTMKDFMLKRKIYVQQEMERLQLLRKEKQQNRQSKQMKFKIKRKEFKIYLQKVANKVINNILMRQNKQIKLSHEKQFFSFRSFYNNLRNRYIESLKMSINTIKLAKIPFFLNKLKHFYNQLSINNNTLTKNQKIKNQKTLLKIFYKWKAYVLWNRQQNYKNRYNQLQPQINRISELQKQVVDQKNILICTLQNRQLQIQQYIKKCEEYQYLLQSKQIKYEKLRNIYQYPLERPLLHNKTPKKTDYRKNDLSKRENIYIKYLPQNKRLQATINNTFQQHHYKNHQSQEKKSGFLANFKNKYIERLQQTPLQITDKDPFISPFKNF